MKGKISVTDVAKQAKVSRTTVMNVLNGNYEKMKKETFDRVMETIETTGYVRKIAPSLLAGGNSRVIAVMLKDNKKKLRICQKTLLAIVSLEEYLFREGYHLVLHVYENVNDITQVAQAWHLEGIILLDENIEFEEALKKNVTAKIRNMDIKIQEKWTDDESRKEMNKNVKELLALSRKCGKI